MDPHTQGMCTLLENYLPSSFGNTKIRQVFPNEISLQSNLHHNDLLKKIKVLCKKKVAMSNHPHQNTSLGKLGTKRILC